MVQTRSGVNKNLWRRRQSGLYAPDDRNFVIDGLVFYAPLWHEANAAAGFYAWDIENESVHNCVVTGAVWNGYSGRHFDGSDDKIVVGDVAALKPSLMTIEAWVLAADYAKNQMVLSKHSGPPTGTNNGYCLFLHSSVDDKFYYQAGDGVTWATYSVVSTSAYTALAWHHICITHGSSVITMYIDGQVGAPTDTGGSIDPCSNDLWIGRDVNQDASTWNNFIGEVRIYNRELSDIEVKRNYRNTRWRYA